uniref:S5 DRBM domain-containing protein n=1 Tax=Marmota marmota marmota TaxID=9994 RepID=A0A8C6ERI6_MARMA
MADDAGAAGGPRGPRGPRNGWPRRLPRRLRQQSPRPRPRGSWRQGRGQGVDPGHQAGPPGQGHEDQVPGGDLSLLFIMPVQKQTRAGQRTRFKAFVAIGDYNGHVELGVKCSKEVATAIRGAIILAKLSICPVRRGYWGNKIGKPHTVPCKVTGCCGTGIVSTPVPKKLLMMAGIDNCYTSARGCTATLGHLGFSLCYL